MNVSYDVDSINSSVEVTRDASRNTHYRNEEKQQWPYSDKHAVRVATQYASAPAS